jgi:cytochrome P450
MVRAVAQIDELIFRIIAERRGGPVRDDFLGTLLAAQDDDGSGMTDRQLRDEAVTLFLAGHETTALTLAHTLYLLSTHPDVERKLHAELVSVLGDRTPVAADVKALPYLERVIKESMRLYPPAWIVDRNTIADDEIMGYRVPAGTMLLMSPWVTHRHPALWPNPEGFDPERFTAAAEAARPRYAYFPFGGGPRQCIGNGFATMEAGLILATVLQRFRPWLVPGHPVVPEPLITLRPRGGLPMGLRRATPGA